MLILLDYTKRRRDGLNPSRESIHLEFDLQGVQPKYKVLMNNVVYDTLKLERRTYVKKGN